MGLSSLYESHPLTDTEGAPGTECVPGSWGSSPVRTSICLAALCSWFSRYPKRVIPTLPAVGRAGRRSGPIFSSAPFCGASGRAARFVCVFCIPVALTGAPRALRRGGGIATPPPVSPLFHSFTLSLFHSFTLSLLPLVSVPSVLLSLLARRRRVNSVLPSLFVFLFPDLRNSKLTTEN